LPDDSSSLIVTDPPYYDLVPYADLSDFFYIWLKRSVGHLFKEIFLEPLSPKHKEIVQLSERNPIYNYNTKENYERLMAKAMTGEEKRRKSN
jgi:putative DNA methylase